MTADPLDRLPKEIAEAWDSTMSEAEYIVVVRDVLKPLEPVMGEVKLCAMADSCGEEDCGHLVCRMGRLYRALCAEEGKTSG